jgi:stearoyl-CoA desaturase (delta-9 desaturase)
MNVAMVTACRAVKWRGVPHSITWFTLVHLGAAVGVWHASTSFSWQTVLLASITYCCCHLSITAGNHRLFCHKAYRAAIVLQGVYLIFIAATMQKSTLWWVWMHRRHHAYSDTTGDPYSTTHGFWWAHILWIVFSDDNVNLDEVKDLTANRLIMLQHDRYYPLAIVTGLAMPTAIAALWGDALGGLLVGGFLRLFFQYHFTFCINSLMHWGKRRRYSQLGTACVNVWLAFPTMGESYHEPHHWAEDDYRLGRRWYDFDPGKWHIWTCSKVGLARGLKRVSEREVRRRVGRALAAAQATV